MTSRLSSRRGVFISMRHGIRRAWLVSALVVALAALPALRAEAYILWGGDVSPLENRVILVGPSAPGWLTVSSGQALTLLPQPNDLRGIEIGGNEPSGYEGQGSVVIDGVSAVLHSRIDITGTEAFISVGRWGAASTGELTITNGGVLTGTSLYVGRGTRSPLEVPLDLTHGSTGTVSVSGSGSAIHLGVGTSGNAAFVSIGREGGAGSVTLSDQAVITIDGSAATQSYPYLTVGRDEGTAASQLTVDNATLTLTGNSQGGVLIVGGGPDAVGTFTIQNHGIVTIDAGGLGCCMIVGQKGTGTLTVDTGAELIFTDIKTGGVTLGHQLTGVGSLYISNGGKVTVQGSPRGGMTIGRLGHGTLEITGGGQLVAGGLPSGGGGYLIFGGNNATATGGSFDVLISGVGSTLSLEGTDASFSLGYKPGASGTMTVSGGATVNADLFAVGRTAGSSAVMNVSGDGTTINLTGDPEGSWGAFFTVGTDGRGEMSVTAGARIKIVGPATPEPTGFSVGGSRTIGAGGTGTLTVDGLGTLISIEGNNIQFNVGLEGPCLNGGLCNMPSTGTMTVSGGARVCIGATECSASGPFGVIGGAGVGETPGSEGTLIVTGEGSLVDAGTFLGIGQDLLDVPGGKGTLTVSSGGTVKATTIHCGGNGTTINGTVGFILGHVTAYAGCVVSPGLSPGTLSIIGSLTSVAGKIVLEVDAFGNHDVLAVEGTAAFDPATQVEVRVDPAFRPSGGTTLQLVQVQPTPQDPVQPLLTLNVAESGGGTVKTQGDLSTLAQPPIVVPDISIPPAIRAVQIDIKPGAFPNVINLGSAGAIPVAILSTPAFDALTVDPLTITLDGAQVKLVGKGQRPLCSAEDVNGDGRKDLLCHIVTSGLPEEGDGVAILDAMAFPAGSNAGIPIRGADFIRIVP